MSTEEQTTGVGSLEELPDHIKWDVTFDAGRLRREVSELIPTLQQRDYFYYNVVALRGQASPSKPGHAAGGAPTDYSDPSLHEWGDFPPMGRCPYIKEISESFGTEVTSVRLMRLQAGADVQEHTDPTLDATHRTVVRLTLPIFSNDDVTFLLNRVPVPMQPGEVWYLKLSDPHAVLNRSTEERINLSIDLIYNDPLEEKLFALAGMACPA